MLGKRPSPRDRRRLTGKSSTAMHSCDHRPVPAHLRTDLEWSPSTLKIAWQIVSLSARGRHRTVWGMGLGAPGISAKWGILFFQRLEKEGDAWVVPSF